MTTDVFGFPYSISCAVLALIVVGGLGFYADGRRRAARARPLPGRVVRVSDRFGHSAFGEYREMPSVMATIVVPDGQGGQKEVLTFPTGRVGGIWVGRELTMWQGPDLRRPPRLERPGRSKRGLNAAGVALAFLAAVVAVHQMKIDQDSVAVLKPIGIVAAVCFAVTALVCLVQLLATQRILRGTPAAGQVLGLVKHTTENADNTTSTSYQPIVAFTAADGTNVIGLAWTSSSLRKRWAGRKVQVRYLPGHPERFRLASPSEIWDPAFGFLMSLVMVAAGLVATGYAIRR